MEVLASYRCSTRRLRSRSIIAKMAAHVQDSIALITLVDSTRQWFKSATVST